MEEHRFGDCRDAATELLRTADLTGGEKAQAFLALSYSLAALQSGQEAISPAELAVYFSREAGDYDLTGRALCHLAVLYGENGLGKRAVACLDEYFQLYGLYGRARALEGRVLAQLAQLCLAASQVQKAVAYGKRACQWYVDHDESPRAREEQRGRLTWLYLKAGQVEPAKELLAATQEYLREAPNDLEARACFLSNTAYRYYLIGAYTSAIDMAVQVLEMRGVAAVWRAQACLTLHYTARALGRTREALGFGTLARIQATVARRADLEQEAIRSMLHIGQKEGLPLMDELLRSLRQRRAE
ncbi:MAG TPA: hypothetical protein VNT75_25670 [Symbiobacteriaceae bacterium]|nr:hypothetical protein [Symbiobacteriaceae bacterium]